tara:strand:- start:6230 stop:6958 length:729 start_codon:yes stop_codon:yes gene_type:complete
LVLGAVFGSFASMLPHRMPHGLDLLGRRSACPSCETPLGARHLFPVLCCCLSRGRCRLCQSPVSWRYPLTEVAMVVAFLGVWWVSGGIGIGFSVLAALAFVLLVMSVIVLEHGYLPDSLQAAAAVLAVVWHALPAPELVAQALDSVLGLAVLGGAGLAVKWGFQKLRGRDSFGPGDVKLLAVAGLWLGLGPAPLNLVASGLGGTALAIVWQRAGLGREFPLGPSLALVLYLRVLFPAATGYI